MKLPLLCAGNSLREVLQRALEDLRLEADLAEELAAQTPAQVKAASAKWLTRPVYALTVVPGARDAYVEATPPAKVAAAPEPEFKGTRGALPPVIDLEWNHQSRSCPHRPGPAEVHREVGQMVEILHRHYGQRPILYVTVDFYRDTGIGRLNAEFWLRSVADHPSRIYPGQRWTFWQYTGTGTSPGFGGNVDLEPEQLLGMREGVGPVLAEGLQADRADEYGPQRGGRGQDRGGCVEVELVADRVHVRGDIRCGRG